MSALIYKKPKSPNQSASFKDKWILEFLRSKELVLDAATGWSGCSDTQATQIKLEFSSMKEAVSYAKENNIEYTVSEPHKAEKKPAYSSYLSNFK